MSNDVITVGSKTTTGGSVISGHGGVIINGQKVALVGDIATCPCGSKSCRGQGPIIAQSPRAASVFGTNLARVGDLVDTGCGSCFLEASSHQVSLNTSTATNLNMGSGVNIGNGVNINGGNVNIGSGVTFGSQSSITAGTDSSVASVQSSSRMTSQLNTPEINPNNMYWPPYNFLAKEGDKEIHIRYMQDVVETTVLAPEEWKEFFDALDKIQNIGGAMKGTYDAFDTAKKLGGLGVTAYVKTHNGVDYLILKGYKQHMKTLLAGNRFKASNPQVVKLALGALDSAKGMARYVKVTAPMEILVGSAINVLQYVLNDEYMLRNLGVDQAKLLVNTLAVAGTALAIGTLAAPTTILAGAVILVIASLGVWTLDQFTDFEKKLVNTVLDQFND